MPRKVALLIVSCVTAVLGLLLFTFILVLDQISQLMKILVSRGADLQTVVRAFLYLLPSIFSVTIPMAFLTGLLIALGRMSGDRESVALLACGVSPVRLLRPVLIMGVVIGLADLYVMVRGVPDAKDYIALIDYNVRTLVKAVTGGSAALLVPSSTP